MGYQIYCALNLIEGDGNNNIFFSISGIQLSLNVTKNVLVSLKPNLLFFFYIRNFTKSTS